MSKITLNIDGKEVTARSGDTVLQAARKAGIDIPTLCAHEELEPYGGCRLCIVQIDKVRGFPTSCTTPAADGMAVKTETDEIFKLRKNILKLMLSGHTSPCLVCLHKDLCEKFRPDPEKSGKAIKCETCSNKHSCELRDLSARYEVDDLELPIVYKDLAVERDDPWMDRDYNLCVLCGRCSRICSKIHGEGSIGFVNRGSDARIGSAFGRDHSETNCRFCGACIDICPTGALSDRFTKWKGIPDKETRSNCTLCPVGCSLTVKQKDGAVIGTRANNLTHEARICATGRFVLPQMFGHHSRITSHMADLGDGQRKASLEDAVALAAEKLTGLKGEEFAFIADAGASREDLFVWEQFTRKGMKSKNFIVTSKKVKLGAEIKAVITTGDFIRPRKALKPNVIVLDVYPTAVSKEAGVVIGTALPGEREGSWLSASGINQLKKLVSPPQDILPDWKVVSNIAARMQLKEQTYGSIKAVRAALDSASKRVKLPDMPKQLPMDNAAKAPDLFRGHKLREIFTELQSVVPTRPVSAPAPDVEEIEPDEGKRFQILKKHEIVANTHFITVHAPAVAKKCKAGQFAIAMVNEKSERIPYTISDWDREAGTITFNSIEVGRSSRELSLLKAGDSLAHFVGPLGKPIEAKNYGTVVLGGGCYGVSAMLPLARALKDAGNKVIAIEEASASYLLVEQRELLPHVDEFLVVTKDGSKGMKGGVQEVIRMLGSRGEKIGQAFICGCPFMMMLVCDTTRELEIPTLTALNPIMLDGTGMCGACRVRMGDATMFACVDGPWLDGHQIDWEELMQRRSGYVKREEQALPQDPHAHEHRCRAI